MTVRGVSKREKEGRRLPYRTPQGWDYLLHQSAIAQQKRTGNNTVMPSVCLSFCLSVLLPEALSSTVHPLSLNALLEFHLESANVRYLFTCCDDMKYCEIQGHQESEIR